MNTFDAILDKNKILIGELLKNHTTFHIGGPADIMLLPETESEIVEIVKLCNRLDKGLFVLGGGSNLLVSDSGIRDVVIKLGDNFRKFEIDGKKVVAQSGIKLTALSGEILRADLSGFEFASGIPGTVGGGVYMNAGAYDSEMKNIVKKVRVVDRQGNVNEYDNAQMNFGYRHSDSMTRKDIIVEVEYELEFGNYDEIKSKIDEFTLLRRTKQPISEFSAGSTFKRPTGYFAGKLIQDAGLKGFSIGEAKISELHSGFVINKGNCTFKEMIEFIEYVKQKVYENSGVMLEEEVRIIGS